MGKQRRWKRGRKNEDVESEKMRETPGRQHKEK